MKLILSLIFFFISVAAFSESPAKPQICEITEVRYKLNGQISKLKAELCTNAYGQFHSKDCQDGCEFKDKLKSTGSIKTETEKFGSPGGKVCSQLGYQAYLVEFDFKGQLVKNIDFCFTKSKDRFVSTGLLGDLNAMLTRK